MIDRETVIRLAVDATPCSHGRSYSQKQLAQKYGLSEAKVSRLLAGEGRDGRLLVQTINDNYEGVDGRMNGITNFDVVKKLYNRPTDEQALREVIKDYMRRFQTDGRGMAPIEGIVSMAQREVNMEAIQRKAKANS